MANTIDILTCTHASFLNYLENSTPKEQTFKDMFSQFNEKYINLSKEIYQINEVRAELLDKIKSAQQEYKRLLGHGEIKPVTDINDDEENEKSAVPEEKVPDKRGRKKVEVKETLNVSKENTELEHEGDIDLENIPKMKSKVVKETKKTVKHVEEPEKIVEEETEVEEQPVVKTTKKTSSQVSTQPVVKKTTKAVKKVEPEVEPEVVVVHEEVKPTVSKVKKTVTKSTKKETIQEQEVEPEPEVEAVQEVKVKSTKKKTGK